MFRIEGPVKWGIIGCGDVCEIKSGPAFSKIEGSSLVSVMRRDAAKAADFARRHHVPTYYTDAQQLIDDPAVNAIYIATPPESHEKYAIQAMKAGKPVYIEKPVALNNEACQRMIRAANEYNVPATVAHYRRELAIFKRVKALINENAIGEVKLVILNLFQSAKPAVLPDASENWRINPAVSGGGPFYDLAPHQLDILYWIFGPATSVQGYSLNQGKNYRAPDVTSLTGIFRDNIFFQGLWSFNVPEQSKHDSCKIIGDAGTLEFPFFTSFTNATLEITQAGVTTKEQFTFPENIQQPMIGEVVKFFQGKGQNPCALTEALTTMVMMDKTYPEKIN